MDAGHRMAASAGSLAFTAVLWLLAGVILLGGFRFAYPANVAPILLGGIASVLMTGLFVREAVAVVTASRRRQEEDPPDTDAGPAAERVALAWVAGSIALLILLGFLVGMSIALVGLLRVYGRERWTTTLFTACGVMVTLYLAFGLVLDVPFYPGVLGLWN